MRIYQSIMKYLIMTYLKEEAFGIESITVRNLQTNKLIAMFSNDIQLQSNNF